MLVFESIKFSLGLVWLFKTALVDIKTVLLGQINLYWGAYIQVHIYLKY